MKKRGFTLIELLATIVILAIVALIAVPVVLNIIENSRKGAARTSALSYVKAINQTNMSSLLTDFDYKYQDGLYEDIYAFDDVEIDGVYPLSGEVTLLNNKVSEAELCINSYYVEYNEGNAEVTRKCSDRPDDTPPEITIEEELVTTNSIVIKFKSTDEDSGIRKNSCYYSIDNSYATEAKIIDNTCIIEKLNNNQKYNYKIKSINKHRKESEVKGSLTTKEIGEVEIIPSPSSANWTSKRTIILSGAQNGSKLQYQMGESVSENNWIEYIESFNMMANTNLYVRLTDGVNTTDAVTYSETKIDISKPILTLVNESVTTNSIEIEYSAVDNESDIKEIKCYYSMDTSYNNVGIISDGKCLINGLIDGKSYNYKIITENNAGLLEEITRSINTDNFSDIVINTSPKATEWTDSRSIILSGAVNGQTLQYQIGESVSENNWINYSEAFNIIDNTNLYVRITDGLNTTDTTTYSETKIDKTAPVVAVIDESSTTKSITIEFSNIDDESDIKETKCYYSIDESYASSGVVSDNKCLIDGLSNNQNYNYKIVSENNASLTREVTGTITTGDFSEIIITPNPAATEWTNSRSITLSGAANGQTLQYQIGESVNENSWINYSGAFNMTTNTNLYVRLTDGVNTTDAVTYSENKIDTSEPSLTIVNELSTTKDIEITFNAEDSDSDIKEVKCYYSENTSYNNEGLVSSNLCKINNLTNGKTYNYKIVVLNNANLSSEITGTVGTKEFGTIEINESPNAQEYTDKRTITITGLTNGATIEYQIGETVDDSAWVEYTETFEIEENTNVYARLTDGVNISDAVTYNESKIVKTKPTIAVEDGDTDGSIKMTFIDEVGLAGYALTSSSDEPTSYTSISGKTSEITTTIADGTYYVWVKSISGLNNKAEIEMSTQVENFSYRNSVYTYIAPSTGTYKLEVWGAQGGYRSSTSYGGKGGYSHGDINLSKGTKLYVYTGGSGNTGGSSGGFNGGGSRCSYVGGGGASDIRIGEDSLYARVIVAGGGGSDGATNKNGMYGGGSSGGTTTQSYGSGGSGGTQTSGNAFGTGGYGNCGNSGYAGAGGGGWYGGYGSTPDGSADDDRGGGGGSGYVYTSSTASSYPSGCKLNSSYYLDNAETIAGNLTFKSPTGTDETGHSGDGYARITHHGLKRSVYVSGNTSTLSCEDGIDSIGGYVDFQYTGDVQTFTACAGRQYKLEVWGAEGGKNVDGNGNAGKGGYSVGTLSVLAPENLYVYVGGKPNVGTKSNNKVIQGGFNGGGSGWDNSEGTAAGGGASDIRIGTDSLFSRVIVAGGGGGEGEDGEQGGYGGGLIGGSSAGGGGTQTSGGSSGGVFGQGAHLIYDGGAGGGGWYGGGARNGSTTIPTSGNSSDSEGGGGGSGYVYTSSTASSYPSGCLLNESYYLTDAQTIAGNTSFPAPSGGNETGHSGDGFARITYIGNN